MTSISLWFFGAIFSAVADAPVSPTANVDPSPSQLTVEIRNSAGTVLASQTRSQAVSLTYPAAYQPGDCIMVKAPAQDNYLIIQVDDKVAETMLYSATGQVNFSIPFGPLTTGYDPEAFTGTAHQIKARLARLAEITAYRNVAVNPIDQRGLSQYFPHAVASSVTREDPQFFERNAIDGNTQNTHHGKWPYESWGNGKNQDPWLKIDFGREVSINKARLYIRADFPHDTYWTNATIQFSDGTALDITLQKTAAPQDYAFPEKKVRWLQLKNFKQPTQPLGWAAVTEIEVYGKDTVPSGAKP